MRDLGLIFTLEDAILRAMRAPYAHRTARALARDAREHLLMRPWVSTRQASAALRRLERKGKVRRLSHGLRPIFWAIADPLTEAVNR